MSRSRSAGAAPHGERQVFLPAKAEPLRHPARGPAAAGPDPGEDRLRRPRPYPGGDAVFTPYAVDVTLSNPYTFRADRPGQRHGPAGRHRPVRARPERARLGGDGPPVHDAAAPPDRGVARPGRGRPDPARAAERGPRRLVRARRARRPVQRDGRPARGERRDHPPRPRPQPRLPGRRVARAAHAARGPAHLQRAAHGGRRRRPRRRAPSSSSRAASRSSGSTGWPRTCSSSRSSIRAWSCSTCGRTTCGRRSKRPSSRPMAAAKRRGVELDAASAPRADPDPPRPAAHRPGRRQPRRQRGQVHAARRLGLGRRGVDARRRTDRGGRHGRRHRRRPSCRTSSSASTAARGRTRRAAAGAGSGSRSCARSWTCTAARSRSRAASAMGRGSP